MTTKRQSEAIAKMDWDEFEKTLHRPATRGIKRGATNGADLRAYFGEEEFEELKKLAARATVRATALGNVVIIPGIMGSHLTSVAGTDSDLIWVNLARLVIGRIARLRLDAEGGREADGRITVKPTDIDKRTYARLVLSLRARWQVETFAFDWRRDIDAAADALKKFIEDKFNRQPVHLVAHSMGGLVARSFIRRHPKIWERMNGDDEEQARGGRLVMLGTPNHGSFTIPQVLTGDEKLVRWLSKLDLAHSLTGLLEITNTFVGSYQMLPSHDKLSAATQAIYRKEMWGASPVSERHLARAREFHEAMKDATTIQPERMIYIAGCNRRTLADLEIVAPGEFRYTETHDGDGRVPHSLGLLDGVPTYYADESHGGLPKNETIITAIDELLERGRTAALPQQPVISRARVSDAGGRVWHRSLDEYKTGAELERIARRARAGETDADEERAAEETIMRAVAGEDRPARDLSRARSQAARKPQRSRRRVHIEVTHGDITKTPAPIIVVGHYKGITLSNRSALPGGALEALDKSLNGWIGQAAKYSMIGGDLGQLFFIPVVRAQVSRKNLAANAALLAGMGEEGRFTRDDLRYLMLNITYAVSALEHESFATVVIGSGKGNLALDRAVRSTLSGICEALNRLPRATRLSRVQIVERDRERSREIYDTIKQVMSDEATSGLEIKLTESAQLVRKARADKAAKDASRGDDERAETRITVERDGDLFRFSALTRQAVIPVREIEIQSFFAEGIADRLMNATAREDQETFGRLLTTSLIPEDFQKLLDSAGKLTLVLDRATAAFPWEMACFSAPHGLASLGANMRLSRQFRTLLSPAPGIAPQVNERLRVLVIADPAPEPELQLPGARREGREIVTLLSQIKQAANLEIEVIDRIGDAECDAVEILGLVLEGDFDIIHYAGHGIFDEANPSHSGWVFGRNRTLSAREIFRARRVPRLVFANACFSAVVKKGRAFTAEEMNRHLAGLAEAFFERGVENYIGAGWPVQDDLAITFAKAFYAHALAGRKPNYFESEEKNGRAKRPRAARSAEIAFAAQSLGDALAEARAAILHEGSTWGAYHHYGQADDVLMAHLERGHPARRVRRTRTS